jgi:membrane-associated phospholipid phosphatase
MDELHTLEVAVNLFLQSLGGWLTAPMKFFSFFGMEEFYLLLMPILYWCIDAALGLRVGVMLLLTQFTNTFFKLLLRDARPYWFNSQVKALSTESSFGIPSGHSESALGIWGLIAASARNKGVTFACVALIFLISLSRLYLGVHFLSDVLAGWLIGGLLLLAFVRWQTPVENWVKRQGPGAQVGLAAASSLGIILLSLASFAIFPGYSVPAEWAQNAAQAAPLAEIDPLNIDGVFTIAGTWFGMLAGAACLWRLKGWPDVSGTGAYKLLRYFIGMAGVLALWYGLGAIFPRTADLAAYGLRYLRYTLLGLWISILAPLLFARLGLIQFNETDRLQSNPISL